MAGTPTFFEKNRIDLDLGTAVTITVTDSVALDTGQATADQMRNRSNDDGWGTTGSSDAAGTALIVTFPTAIVTDVHLIGINWKAFTIQYWNGSAYVDFSTPIVETANAASEKEYSRVAVEIGQIRIVISATFVANDDKFCAQLILTQLIGAFGIEPMVSDFLIGKNRQLIDMLSGKKLVQRRIGAVSMTISQNNVTTDSDLSLVETLHDYHSGFLVWLCGGTTTQFPSGVRVGWRKKDLYLMNIASELAPNYEDGRYGFGILVYFNLVEVV